MSTEQFFTLGKTMIDILNTAKDTAEGAVRAESSDLRHVSSFLGIIDTTINDKQYEVSAEFVDEAKEKFEAFKAKALELNIPEDCKEKLASVKFPKKHPDHGKMNVVVTKEQYDNFCKETDQVIETISGIMESVR